jgi:hypothetical protein
VTPDVKDIVTMSEVHPTTSAVSGKPAKPTPDFPLFPHATGSWTKKIRGKLYYFGPWADPDAALDDHLRQKDALHAARKPRAAAGMVTVKDVANAFLNHKQTLLRAGELSARTWEKYQTAAKLVMAHMGKGGRVAADLDPEDFAGLRKRMAARWGVYRLGDMIQHVRSICKHGHETGLLPLPVTFGRGSPGPPRKPSAFTGPGRGRSSSRRKRSTG